MFTRSIDPPRVVRSCVQAGVHHSAHTVGAFILVLAGCVSSGVAPGARPVRSAPTTVYVSSQLGIAGSGASVFDALLLLRPSLVQWSYIPGATFEEHIPTVFIDGLRAPSADVLYRIPCTRVRKIIVLDRAEAKARYGPDVVGGAILVTSAIP